MLVFSLHFAFPTALPVRAVPVFASPKGIPSPLPSFLWWVFSRICYLYPLHGVQTHLTLLSNPLYLHQPFSTILMKGRKLVLYLFSLQKVLSKCLLLLSIHSLIGYVLNTCYVEGQMPSPRVADAQAEKGGDLFLGHLRPWGFNPQYLIHSITELFCASSVLRYCQC